MKEYIQVNGTGLFRGQEEMRFNGICVGSWLNIEHFMIGWPGPEHMIRKTVERVAGKETAAVFFQNFHENFLSEEDFLFLQQCNVNLIRVPFNYRLFLDDEDPEAFHEEGFRQLDRILPLCRKYGIYLLLDLHSVPGGQNPDWHSDNGTGISQFWHFGVFRKQVVKLWRKLAGHYVDEEMILGYDLLNEPFLMGAPDVLDDFFAEVTRAVREVDTHHILFLEGDHFAMDFQRFHELSDKNTAFSFHFYPTVWEPELLTDAWSRDARNQKFATIL